MKVVSKNLIEAVALLWKLVTIVALDKSPGVHEVIKWGPQVLAQSTVRRSPEQMLAILALCNSHDQDFPLTHFLSLSAFVMPTEYQHSPIILNFLSSRCQVFANLQATTFINSKVNNFVEGTERQSKIVESMQALFTQRYEIAGNNRFMNASLPVLLPQEAALFRGLSKTKGSAWGQCLAELIVQGPGSRTDLSSGLLQYQMSSQLGRRYFTTDIHYALNPDAFFDKSNGALVIIQGEYFNQAQLNGRAYLEKENSLNTVFLDEIPHKYVAAIVLPGRYSNSDGSLNVALPEFSQLNAPMKLAIKASSLLLCMHFCPEKN